MQLWTVDTDGSKPTDSLLSTSFWLALLSFETVKWLCIFLNCRTLLFVFSLFRLFYLRSVAVDDEVVEKLLQLVGDADQCNYDVVVPERPSLKSVAGVLYGQQRSTYGIDNSDVREEHSRNDTDKVLSTTVAAASSNDVSGGSQTSVSGLSLGLPCFTSSATETSHDTAVTATSASNISDQSPASVFYSSSGLRFTSRSPVETSLDTVTAGDVGPQTVERSTATLKYLVPRVSVLSSTTPTFCIPTSPVLSARTRGLEGHRVCGVAGQKLCRYENEATTTANDTSPTVLLTDVQSVPVISSNSIIGNTSARLRTTLPNVQPSCLYTVLPSVPSPSLSHSYPIVSRGRSLELPQATCCQYNDKILTTTTEAVNRLHQLHSAGCKVLVLMRGCPGSGKTTMAMCVPFVSYTAQ